MKKLFLALVLLYNVPVSGALCQEYSIGVAPPLNNYGAITNPSSTNDNTQGYSIGSFWLNTSTGKLYVASSVVTNSAVWNLLN
jgi:hypothetical protein